jgi:hypothetical protein
MRTTIQRLAIFTATSLWASAALAQGYASLTFGQQFQFGAMTTLNGPIILLALIPVGLLTGLWHGKGKGWMWAGLLGGLAAGLLLAQWAPVEVVLSTLVFAIVTSVLAIMDRPFPRAIPIGAAAITGALAVMIMFYGNPFGALPVGIYLGVTCAMIVVMTIASAITIGILRTFPYATTRIVMRILSSWVAAVAIMYLAFVLHSVG